MLGIIVPIPTGLKTYNVTLTARRTLLYHCATCGKRNTHEFEVRGFGSKQFHVLQSKDKKAAIQKATEDLAQNSLDANDQSLFKEINVDHDYSSIKFEVICPDCGSLQPWSDMRGLFRKSSRLADLKTAKFDPPTYVNASNVDVLIDQQAPQKKVKEPPKPVVSTHSDSSAGKTSEPVKSSPKPVARFCAKCGTKMPSNAVFCPKCGHKRVSVS